MKKIVLFIIAITLLLSGCNASNFQNSYYENVLGYEKVFLKSNDTEDLKNLCFELILIKTESSELNALRLKYLPMLFARVNEDELADFALSGFDDYYALYVSAFLAENNKKEFKKLYYKYKELSSNVYNYTFYVFGLVLDIEDLDSDDLDFLYNESVSIYEQSRNDENIDILSKTYAIKILHDTCKRTGQEDTLKVYEDEIREHLSKVFEELE